MDNYDDAAKMCVSAADVAVSYHQQSSVGCNLAGYPAIQPQDPHKHVHQLQTMGFESSCLYGTVLQTCVVVCPPPLSWATPQHHRQSPTSTDHFGGVA